MGGEGEDVGREAGGVYWVDIMKDRDWVGPENGGDWRCFWQSTGSGRNGRGWGLLVIRGGWEMIGGTEGAGDVEGGVSDRGGTFP
jgi:hypothetical protein